MAHRMLKPYNLLCYLLAVVACFFLGITYAGVIGAGDNQGLAAAAIVLGYGFVAAVIGLVAALYVASSASRKAIVRLNFLLAVMIALCFAYFQFQYLERQKAKAGGTSMLPSTIYPLNSEGEVS